MFAGTGASDKKSTFLLDSNIQFNSSTERNLVGMIADISRIQVGDNIIFYLQAANGNQGLFLVCSKQNQKLFLMKMTQIII